VAAAVRVSSGSAATARPAPLLVHVKGHHYFTEMCSGSEAGSYLRLIDFVFHSTLGLRVIQKKKRGGSGRSCLEWECSHRASSPPLGTCTGLPRS